MVVARRFGPNWEVETVETLETAWKGDQNDEAGRLYLRSIKIRSKLL